MNRINLVPIGYKKRHKRQWYILLSLMGSGAICVVLISLGLIPLLQINLAQQEQELILNQLEAKEIIEIKTILEQKKTAEVKYIKVVEFLEDLDGPTHIRRQTMDNILGSVPKGLRINEIKMKHQDGIVAINGQAHDITKVAQYIIQLNSTKQFEIMDYKIDQNSDFNVPGWMNYSIMMRVKNVLISEVEVEGEDYEVFYKEE